MNLFLLFLIFVLGLCFGSFINMLVYRTAVRYKLRNPPSPRLRKGEKRSFCDYCGKQLKWYENVPMVSWLMQKGKTRCCNKKLLISYPIVELVMGVLFVIAVRNGGTLLQLGLGFIIIVLLVFSAIFDWKYKILPDFSIIILIIVAFIGVVFDELNIIPYLLSALIASGFLLVLNLITKGEGMGMGDVKFALFMGLILGYPNIILAFYIAFVVGAVYGLVLIILKKAARKSQIPFGPFLILGTMMAWWWGDPIIKFLISNF